MGLPHPKRPPEWGVEPVPPEARVLGTFDLFVLWASLGVGLLVFAAGDWLVNGFGLNLEEVVIVSIVGSLIGSLLLALAAVPGSRHGVPTMVSLRPVLGLRGSGAAAAWNAFQLVGWASFELLVIGMGVQRLLRVDNSGLAAALAILLVAMIVLMLAIAGPLAVVRAWIRKFAIWGVLLSTAYIGFLIATSGRDLSFRWAPASYTGAGSMMRALDLVIVLPISWWPLVADYNRFARSPKASLVGTVAGYSVANALFFILGAALVLFAAADPLLDAPYIDFFFGLSLLSLGALPLFIILVDETDNAFANIYSTAVSVQNIRPKLAQARTALVATAIATVGALYFQSTGEGLGGGYEQFLILIGGLFVPLLGVLIADAFVLRRDGYRAEEFGAGTTPVRWKAVAAWAAGTTLYLLISWNLIAGWPVTGATLPAFAFAALLHLGLARFARVRSSHG